MDYATFCRLADRVVELSKGYQYRTKPPKDLTGWEAPTEKRKTWRKHDGKGPAPKKAKSSPATRRMTGPETAASSPEQGDDSDPFAKLFDPSYVHEEDPEVEAQLARDEADRARWRKESLAHVHPDTRCPRCSGAGRGPWRVDGGRCYRCGGTGVDPR